jgi:hypothetical protein
MYIPILAVSKTEQDLIFQKKMKMNPPGLNSTIIIPGRRVMGLQK